MNPGVILLAAAFLFPVAVRVTVTIFDRIASHRPSVVEQAKQIHP
jgi:hypothetical protein